MATAGVNAWVHDVYNGTATPGGNGGFVYMRDSDVPQPQSERRLRLVPPA